MGQYKVVSERVTLEANSIVVKLGDRGYQIRKT